MAKFICKMQKKSGIMKSGLDNMSFFLLEDLLIQSLVLVAICVSLFIKPVHKRRRHKIGDF